MSLVYFLVSFVVLFFTTKDTRKYTRDTMKYLKNKLRFYVMKKHGPAFEDPAVD